MYVISRKQAQDKGLKFYFTGKKCKKGHLKRYVSNGKCVECLKKYQAVNKERKREYAKRYREANKERISEQKKQYEKNNKERKRKRMKKYRQLNKDSINEYNRKYKRHHRKNRSKDILRMMCDRVSQKLALGKVSQSKFKLLKYKGQDYIVHLECSLPDGMSFQQAREEGFHVDHIVPLSFISKTFPENEEGRTLAFKIAMDVENLSMIPAEENMSKNAKFEFTGDQKRIWNYLCLKYDLIP
jgi:hypothetical protein